ncbi:MAG: serine/threonine protein kinase [Polyangiaceae bacterium]|nr:serine/threonine protein kinase [Polyangiaceae bacterium]
MGPASSLLGGRYALGERIGAGGMGEVFRARHTSLNTDFAVKLLAAGSAQGDAPRARFLKEAQITAQLKSRHAVTVFDFGVSDEGRPYLVMELLQGETLMDRIDRGRLDPLEAVAVLRQCGKALDRAHQLGIIHRDFKPANVILSRDEDGEVAKVLDFGVARLLGELEPERAPTQAPEGTAGLTSFTRTGALLGTPAYMAPEQIDDALAVGAATDLWALGVVAYEALVGLVPFPAEEMGALFTSIRAGAYVPPTRANARLPSEVDAWFARACATDPARRFASASEQVDALAAALGADPHSIPIDRSGPPSRSSGREAEPALQTLDAPRPLVAGHERFLLSLDDSAPDAAIELDAPPIEPRFSAHLERASAPPESLPMTTLRGAAAFVDAPPPSLAPSSRPRAPTPAVTEVRGMPGWVWPVVALVMLALGVVAYLVAR